MKFGLFYDVYRRCHSLTSNKAHAFVAEVNLMPLLGYYSLAIVFPYFQFPN